MTNEQIAALWLQIQSGKLRDMTDLQLAQLVRNKYVKFDNNFKLNPRWVSEQLGINYNHAKRRLKFFIDNGILTRYPAEKQHKGYIYRLGLTK